MWQKTWADASITVLALLLNNHFSILPFFHSLRALFIQFWLCLQRTFMHETRRELNETDVAVNCQCPIKYRYVILSTRGILRIW